MQYRGGHVGLSSMREDDLGGRYGTSAPHEELQTAKSEILVQPSNHKNIGDQLADSTSFPVYLIRWVEAPISSAPPPISRMSASSVRGCNGQ
jgi:hypothetical protein